VSYVAEQLQCCDPLKIKPSIQAFVCSSRRRERMLLGAGLRGLSSPPTLTMVNTGVTGTYSAACGTKYQGEERGERGTERRREGEREEERGGEREERMPSDACLWRGVANLRNEKDR